MFSPLIPMLFPVFWAHLRKSEFLYSGQIWRKRVVSRPIWWLKSVKTWAIWRLSCPMQGFPRTWRRRNQKTGGVEAWDEDARGKQPHICWMSTTTTPQKKESRRDIPSHMWMRPPYGTLRIFVFKALLEALLCPRWLPKGSLGKRAQKGLIRGKSTPEKQPFISRPA